MTSNRSRLTFDEFGTALMLIAIFLIACLKPAQNDTFWALRAGKEILATHRVSTVETWSFTAAGHLWPNHEWLWQVLAYSLYRVGGFPLLTAVNAAVAAASVAVARSLAPPRGRVGLVLLLCAMIPITAVYTLRPQVVTLLLFALTLKWLANERYGRLPLLFLVWANLHGGVLAGGLLLAASAGLAVFEHVRHRTFATRYRVMMLAWVTPVCALVTLLNPMGVGLWTYVATTGSDPAHKFISEWRNAFEATPIVLIFWGWLVGAILLVVLRRHRFTTWSTRVVLLAAGLMAPLAITAVRNIGQFVLVALPIAIIALAPSRGRAADGVRFGRPVLVASAVLCAGLVTAAWTLAPNYVGWHMLQPAAVRAVEQCPGRVYNLYDDGGFLLWYVPGNKVFIDSRQNPYPYSLVKQDHVLGRTGRYRPLFDRYHIQCAFLGRTSPTLKALRRDGWRTTYENYLWAVVVRPR